MKVLQFFRTYLPVTHGGIEESIRQICLATTEHGVEQRVLTLAPVERVQRLERPEATVIQVPLQWEPSSCSIGLGMFSAYREQAQWADVIHVHYPWPFADLVHLLSGVNKPLLVTYHADIIRQRRLEKLYAPLRSRFLSKADRLIATSPDYMASSPVLARYTDKCEVIPLGLEPGSYSEPSAEALAQARSLYGEDFFLFVGVLRYYKGLHVLLDAAALCGLPVIIAGAGPEEATLKQQAAVLGITNVVFVGFVSDDMKAALFTLCRAVVFPSCLRSEAFGVTLLEGQLHSRALISCDIGTGTSYVNQHAETGLVVPPEDPAALAEAMRTLNEDPALAASMGEKGRRRLREVFSGAQVGIEYTRVYQELLK
ncbi:MAG TPA: glycosyltransferase [Pseudomonadaceae bacterium]|nr:glycosyltransferase [Pseudomonadaceae bacterium]